MLQNNANAYQNIWIYCIENQHVLFIGEYEYELYGIWG